jgi:hypothetical protein
MTLANEAARAVAAENYKIASVTADQRYWDNRRSQEAAANAADAARAAAERQSQLPVIVDHPAPATGEYSPVRIGPATDKPLSVDKRNARTGEYSPVVPLPQATVMAWLTDERRFDPQGVAALEREWGGDMGANLAYANAWMARHLTPEQRARATADYIDNVSVIRFLAQCGREEAHTSTAVSTTTKGPSVSETMTKADAEKKFRQLTADMHDARAKGDRLRAKELADERDLLGSALYPGDSGPHTEQKQVIG